MTNKNNRCLTVAEAGERLGISRSLAYELAHSDGFPVFSVGRRLVIPEDAFERWLANRTEKGLCGQ